VAHRHDSAAPNTPDHPDERDRQAGDVPAWHEHIRGSHPGDHYIRISRHPAFQRVRPGIITPRNGASGHTTGLGRLIDAARRRVLGAPLASSEELKNRVGITRGLAIFASDNISSSAYATEALMRVLILAGVSALALALPITLAIILVLGIVIISYLQVVAAYPGGGGSYVVAHENLGPLAGLVAAAALLTDYILTVAVSVSAGIAALGSAFPELRAHRVGAALAVIALITLVNLRGVRESGRVFALPTYLYLVAVLGLIGYGLARYLSGGLPEYVAPQGYEAEAGAGPLTVLLVLRAFASGAVALTGTEAVSNGVPAFQRPEVRNARITLVVMGLLFATIFLGFSFLADELAILPAPDEAETVNSQIARTLIGDGPVFYLIQLSTALLLVLAGNTAFNGFPMLASILAKDGYLPRQFSFRGDRLAFTGGILLLALIASLLVWGFQGSVTGLIPLYTVGVFLAFTLSQAGLVRRWWSLRGEVSRWRLRLVSNGLGALVTGLVMIVVAVSKFLLGAWIVLVLIPVLVWVMRTINQHYRSARDAELNAPEFEVDPRRIELRVIVPVANLRLPARQAIAYGLAIASPERVTVVHITDDPESAEQLREEWRASGYGCQFVVIESPFRSLLGPFVAYIDAVRETHPYATITVVVPQYVPRRWWEHLLHNQTALRMRAALIFHANVVITTVPFHHRRPGAPTKKPAPRGGGAG